MDFNNKLQNAISENNSLVCVGLDPDPFQEVFLKGKDSLFKFNKKIIDQTFDLVCAYKPNIAFYAAAGVKGIEDLKRTINYIHKKYPQIPVLLDAKRGDVPSTSVMYTREVFDAFKADATTVSPYCGFDSLEPFFKRKDRGIFVICRTSNPEASAFQDLKVEGQPFYIKVAEQIVKWSKKYSNIYLAIGATWPGEIANLRKLTSDMFFLVAGVGAQGGDLEGTLKNGLTKDGRGLIISSSRSIIYSSSPRSAAQKMKDEINKYR